MSEKINFIEGDVSSLSKPMDQEMDKVVKFFEKDILSLRTGKASIAMVENIHVEAYGGQIMKLREVASLSTPDARMIIVHPWDKSMISHVQKGIMASELGINPNVDGEVIRLVFPMMSSERREEIAKQLAKKLEESKIRMRDVRSECRNKIKDAEKDKSISEDFAWKLTELLQKITDSWIEKLEAISKKKENELKAL